MYLLDIVFVVNWRKMTADLIGLGVGGRRKQMKDQVSPFKVAMLVVIEEHCKMIGDKSNEFNTFGKQEENPYTDAEECSLMITMLQIVQVILMYLWLRGSKSELYKWLD